MLFVHGLNDSFQLLLRLHMHDELCIVFHAFFFLPDRFEEMRYFLDSCLVLFFDCFDHVVLEGGAHLFAQLHELSLVLLERLNCRVILFL